MELFVWAGDEVWRDLKYLHDVSAQRPGGLLEGARGLVSFLRYSLSHTVTLPKLLFPSGSPLEGGRALSKDSLIARIFSSLARVLWCSQMQICFMGPESGGLLNREDFLLSITAVLQQINAVLHPSLHCSESPGKLYKSLQSG